MIRLNVSSNGRAVVADLGKKSIGLTSTINRVMQSELQPAKESARGILMKMVYSRPENPKTPRSNNLWLSTETSHVKKGNCHTFYVYNDPAKATNPYQWWGPNRDTSWSANLGSYSGPENFYPAYVSQGNFFGNHVSGTNFYRQWMLDIGIPLGNKLINAVLKELSK